MSEHQSPETLFDHLAELYDDLHTELGWEPKIHVGDIFGNDDLCNLKVLDLGCGTGEICAWFKERGAHPTGLDISVEMCVEAAEKHEGIHFFPCDIGEKLPFDGAEFDIVLALGCLEFLPDLNGIFSEMLRVSKKNAQFLFVVEKCGDDCPGGDALSVDFLDDWQRYRMTRESLEELCAAYFCDVEIKEIDGYVLEDTGEKTRYMRVSARKCD